MILKRIAFIVGCLCCLTVSASENDSIKVEKWISEARTLPMDSCRTLHFAKKMLGVPYVAGALDGNDEEQLVVHFDKLDCTTFVETVLALAITEKQCQGNAFTNFKNALMFVRYRDGKLDGYASRLHYFSDWIKDNERKGILREVTSKSSYAQTKELWLDFMSTHSSSYLPMTKDTSLVQQIATQEKAWQGVEVSYLPKDKLTLSSSELKIKNGDILAITTNIKGLDVVHVGFAFWKGEELHMLHASSVANKVIEDPLSLYEYSKNKKAHTGVRAIRFIYKH